jgi:hypothetical protein
MTKQRDFEQEYDIDSFWRVYYSTCNTSVTYKKRTLLVLLCVLAFISFDSFSYDCLHFDRTVIREAGDYSIFYHNASNGELQTNETCTGQVVLSTYDYAVLVTKSQSSDGFTDLFTMSQTDYESLAKSFLILLAFAVSLKLVLRQLMPR